MGEFAMVQLLDGPIVRRLIQGRFTRRLALLVALVPLTVGAAAAQTYPSKSIKLIVPYSAGGASDISARQVAAKLENALGQSVVVENMPTAAGVVAFGAAAKAPADGYTLLFTQASLIITKAIRKDVPYDALTDFEPISLLLEMQSVMTVRPGLPVNNIKELVDLAKRQKGQLTYASLGNGSEPHLIMEMFKNAAQVDNQMVPYKITPTIYTDMIADRIDMMLALMPSALPQIKGNKLRGLGVSGPQRSPALPDTPTIREAGVPFAQSFWSGLMAPRGTPADVIEKLHTAAQKAIADPDVKAWALSAGAEMRGSTSAAFATHLRDQTAVWTKLVNELGLKAE
jgi:tripartite-type tricarboxylate transporter receptor subunit TctC